jgi:tRNA(Ile2) C34 agmatinyltransferase TiaS
MSKERATEPPICPICGAELKAEGELLRCAAHGEFFSYGPRLLVRVPRQDAAAAPLMPWQTLQEKAIG